jgi:signal transduction histidine kinase
MENWNKQLKRIIWRNLGKEKSPPIELIPLFQSISDSFDSHDKEYSLLNRIMDLSSEELFNANKELRKRNEELDQFMYSTSHDLRAPLTSIMGLLQLIDFEKDEKKKGRYLDLMKASTTQLDDFIQDIVAYTHNKKVDVLIDTIDFESLIDKCFERLTFMNTTDEIEKVINVHLDVPFYSDSQRLDNLISNLVSNSIKYYDPKKEAPFVKIAVCIDNSDLSITVQDNGLGIRSEHHSRIFDMFYRASSDSKGSGIGLYIVKEIVEKLSGSIRMESTFGIGTTFNITIPNLKN